MNNTTPNMTEKELLTDLLNTEKQLVKEYATNITEASCANLRQVLVNNLWECSQDQYSVFDQMRQHNMYKVKDAPDNDVQTAKQSVQQLKTETGF